MPFNILTLDQARANIRDHIAAKLHSGPMVPNSVARILADGNAGLAFLTFLYLQWLSLQLLPDKAEDVWLNRFANIWLIAPRKPPFYAVGSVLVSGIAGSIIPLGQQFISGSGGAGPAFGATAQTTIGAAPTVVPIVALPGSEGTQGNLAAGTVLGLLPFIPNVAGTATVISLYGGAAAESDDELRARVLLRIQQPPMGGDSEDYVQWALNVPGVTRAWTSPLEMGVGTVTLRFMMDDLRAANSGFPTTTDVAAVQAYIDSVRPVTVIDVYVVAPVPFPVNFTLKGLTTLNSSTMANVNTAVSAMLASVAAPASSRNGLPIPPTTIYAAWINQAVLSADGVDHFDLIMDDLVPPNNSSLAVLGSIVLE
jgi:uncharacterized phage protein gp47/JayE